ncbi:hypothetical protein B0H10DRAFT_161518 [Mycena sp. CBHHK59/15]|nr:hypothetical protein B0H10DRAFT_161518 [Mycena sp. CBHHK59/15]
MDYTIPSTVFSKFWDLALADLCEAIAEVLLYGVLVVLVAFAAYVLCLRKAAGSVALAAATGVMFILATVQLATRLRTTIFAFKVFHLAVQGEIAPQSRVASAAMEQYVAFNFVEDILLVTNNLVTDGVFIYRCFLIWGRNLYVVSVPAVMLLLTTVLSYISAYEGDYPSAGGPHIDLRIGFMLSVLTNIVLVGLTAGRIWHTQRTTRSFLPSSVGRRYNTATTMILESGAILCAWVVAGGLAQIVNIVPTLIIVRVGLGNSLKETSKEKAASSDRLVV